VVKHLRNLYRLKWLRPRVVFSRHANLQEKLLGDLRRKVLWGVANADFGPHPCNCPRQYKVNGECAYGGECFTCRTAGSIYKILPNCNCFYVGKSQQYIKTRIQEHIGEVTKLYNKSILLPNRSATTPPLAHLQGSSTCSSTMSLAMQQQSETSYQDPLLSQLANGMCIIIDDAMPPQPPISLTITRAPSDVSDIDQLPVAPQPPIVNFGDLLPTPEIPFYARATTNLDAQQDNCSALACQLFAHVKNLWFNTKAEVTKWCRTNITVDILWHSNTNSLVKTAGQKVCRLCKTERMIIGQNFTSTHSITMLISRRNVSTYVPM
jgi:hypothetical protein